MNRQFHLTFHSYRHPSYLIFCWEKSGVLLPTKLYSGSAHLL
jgi:hypothetical protein